MRVEASNHQSRPTQIAFGSTIERPAIGYCDASLSKETRVGAISAVLFVPGLKHPVIDTLGISPDIGTNINRLELSAMVLLLATAAKQGVNAIELRTDSTATVGRISDLKAGRVANDEVAEMALHLINQFEFVRIKHIPREQNSRADAIAKSIRRQSEPETSR